MNLEIKTGIKKNFARIALTESIKKGSNPIKKNNPVLQISFDNSHPQPYFTNDFQIKSFERIFP